MKETIFIVSFCIALKLVNYMLGRKLKKARKGCHRYNPQSVPYVWTDDHKFLLHSKATENDKIMLQRLTDKYTDCYYRSYLAALMN
jgi:hypothetical protein